MVGADDTLPALAGDARDGAFAVTVPPVAVLLAHLRDADAAACAAR